MKRFFPAMIFVLLFPAFVPAQSVPGAGRVEVNFVYTRQSGSASNQFAVWVEDDQGKYVKTLYATRFTAEGGWKNRPVSIQRWVQRSGLSGMSKSQVDAFTGPTPRGGSLRYVWDGTNQAGLAVRPGSYRVFVEATLRNENAVLYSADITLGGSGTLTPSPQYSGGGTAERGMIGGFSVKFSL